MRVPMRAEVATRFVETMLARFEVPDMFNEDPKRPVPVRFDTVMLELIRFARFEVPEMFSEEPVMDIIEIFDAVRFDETMFARLLVPEILAVVDLADPVMRLVHSKLRTFDVPERFIVDPTS
jgi:hypothetical protein